MTSDNDDDVNADVDNDDVDVDDDDDVDDDGDDGDDDNGDGDATTTHQQGKHVYHALHAGQGVPTQGVQQQDKTVLGMQRRQTGGKKEGGGAEKKRARYNTIRSGAPQSQSRNDSPPPLAQSCHQ